MALIDYLNKERTTIDILKDWRNQEWRREHASDVVRDANDRMLALRGQNLSTTPVQGGGNSREELLCNLIDKKTVAERGRQAAEEYFAELLPAWNCLSEDERWMLTVRFVDKEYDGGGIRAIMARYHIEKTKAYDMSNAALQHLARLLFW